MATAHFHAGAGHLPANARESGFEADHQLLYVARIAHEGGLHPGKYRGGWSQAVISYGGKEVWASSYEVWVGQLTGGSGGVWNVPANISDPVAVGREANGTALYAARARHDGGLHLGKWQKGWTSAAIPYGGSELWLTSFEVLCAGQYLDGDPAFSWQQ